ncbi:MAG: (deoxy)nucleoside triphosphate pyrophosphohydrolase [Desulfobacterales bacterium]|nr:(deoxy)nucleoside triphosphate pyrophosphohydrolase [Desulfobacterales bacterium]
MAGEQCNHIGEVVCAIIEDKGRFLIAQRPSDHQLANKWEFPGGKVGDGEASFEALEREINEELDLIVEIIDQLTPNDHSYPNFSLTLIPFRCSIIEGVPDPTEHQQIAWVTIDMIDSYEFSPADIPILNEYLSQRRIE